MMNTKMPSPAKLLPRETTQGRDNMEVFERLGFRIGAPQDEDFVRVKYPRGWRTKTDQDGIVIVDDQRRIRAEIWRKDDTGVPLIEPVERFTLGDACLRPWADTSADTRVTLRFNDNAANTVTREPQADHSFSFGVFEDHVPGPLIVRAVQALHDIFPRHADPAAYWNDIVESRVEALQDAIVEAAKKIVSAPDAAPCSKAPGFNGH